MIYILQKNKISFSHVPNSERSFDFVILKQSLHLRKVLHFALSKDRANMKREFTRTLICDAAFTVYLRKLLKTEYRCMKSRQ